MLTGVVIGDDRIAALLNGFSDEVQAGLGRVMLRLALTLQRKIVDEKLSGQVLGIRSGRLRGSISAELHQDGQSITATVGSDASYAAFQEYGFSGSETVRAHLRTIRQAFGRPIREKQILVRPYIRRVDYPAHSFLRSALADLQPDFAAALEASLAEAARGIVP
ncbi:MAG TPA: HK97 gp10 family phage protein [Stellaceae bacterium]|nr:HK97 gp10 family phage protein [Stellaceae bacterium]